MGSRRVRAVRLATVAIMAAGLVSGDGRVAAQATGDPTGFSIEGVCDRLVVNGEDASRLCRGVVIMMMLPYDRVLFIFAADEGRILTFSGDARRVETPLAGAFMQPVDMVRTGFHEDDLASFAASGRCSGTDPFAGPATIECRADANGTVFAGHFTSDGRPPAELR